MTSNPKPLTLIGISGKPGSVKMRYAAPIIQELRFHGYKTIQTALAGSLYSELNGIIDDWHSNEFSSEELAEKYELDDDALWKDLIALIDPSKLGEKYHYGFSRRNENMRKALNLFGSQIRREQDPDYFLKKMIDSISDEIDFAVFTDLRYPNEVDYLNFNGHYSIRISEPPEIVYSDPEDGFKYSQEGLSDPTETALDEWDVWYAYVEPQTFLGKEIVSDILDELKLPKKEEQVYTPASSRAKISG